MNLDPATRTRIINELNSGKLIYMPTDTIPGLVCSVNSPAAVEKIYKLKQRDANKPPTIIIRSIDELADLTVDESQTSHPAVGQHWPGKVSLVLQIVDPLPLAHLHRGMNSLAVRMTANPELIEIISATGPLATSSANIQDQPPALSTTTAKEYFGDAIDTYIDHPPTSTAPSSIYKIEDDGTLKQLR